MQNIKGILKTQRKKALLRKRQNTVWNVYLKLMFKILILTNPIKFWSILKQIWSKLPIRFLNQPRLAWIWRITRVGPNLMRASYALYRSAFSHKTKAILRHILWIAFSLMEAFLHTLVQFLKILIFWRSCIVPQATI